MDLRWLLLAALIIGVVGFLLGRRTSPTGRALHRLQAQVEAKQVELSQARNQMQSFLADMQGELDRVSLAYQDLQSTLSLGAERLTQSKRALPVANKVAAKPSALAITAEAEPWTAELASSRLAGSWGGLGGGPSLATAAACPLPEANTDEAPKDYPASRRSSGGYDEHSYA